MRKIWNQDLIGAEGADILQDSRMINQILFPDVMNSTAGNT